MMFMRAHGRNQKDLINKVIRSQGIPEDVKEVLYKVDRKNYAGDMWDEGSAYVDAPLPLACCGQTISAPHMHVSSNCFFCASEPVSNTRILFWDAEFSPWLPATILLYLIAYRRTHLKKWSLI